MGKKLFIFVIVIVIGVSLAGFYLKNVYRQKTPVYQTVNQPSLTVSIPTAAITATIPISTAQQPVSAAEKVVQTYYDWYVTCLKNHFNNPSGDHSPQQDCPFNATGALTATLNTKLVQNIGFDGVLCAQNVPQSVTYDKAVGTQTHTTTVVHTVWGNSPQQNITVGLDIQNGSWKISSITCPQ